MVCSPRMKLRSKAKELLGAVAKGDNPAQEISEHRRAATVSTLCERFYREHVEERCKPTTQREYKRAIELYIKPAIGAFKYRRCFPHGYQPTAPFVARAPVPGQSHARRALENVQPRRIVGIARRWI